MAKEKISNQVEDIKPEVKNTIKANFSLPRTKDDRIVDGYIILPNLGLGFSRVRKIRKSWLIANPIQAIKLDIRLAKYTTANENQIKKITNNNK